MKLSIITISKNNATGLAKTLDSLEGQLTDQMELLVIDGASTDDSLKVIQNYRKQINRYVSESDDGIYAAMNKGLQFAKGEYIYFLNAGDSWNKSLNLSEVLLMGDEQDFIFGSCKLVYSESYSYTDWLPDRMKMYDLYDGVCHQAMIIRRALLAEKGGYRTDLLISDWYFMIESLLVQSKSFITLSFVFCEYDFRGVSSTNAGQKRIKKEKRMVWKTHHLAWNKWSYLLYCAQPRIVRKKLFARFIRLLP